MIRRPPISTRTDPRFPYTTLFRSFVETPGLPDEADGSMQREIKSLLTVYRLAETPQWAAATALLAQSRKVQIAGFQTERGIAMMLANHLPFMRDGVQLFALTADNYAAVVESGRASGSKRVCQY